MADREQQQQSGQNTAANTKVAAAPAAKGVRALNHQLSLAHGHPKVAAVVQVMDRYPDDRDAMMEVLHHQLGNGFVQEVVAAIQRSHTARGSQPSIATTANTEHDEHATPAPAPAKAPPAPPANANAAAATPALTPTPAPAPAQAATPAEPAEHYGFWAKAGDAAVLLAELAKLGFSLGIHPISGKGGGDFDLSAAMRIAHVFAGDKFNVTLGALPKGTNRVHVDVDAYNQTFDLTAATLQVGGVSMPAFTAGGCVMSGVTGHYDRRANSGSVAFAHARFQNVTFIRDKEHVTAADMEMADLHVADPGTSAGLSFGNAHVHGLVYPNMPPIDFDMPGGASFAAVWAHEAPTSHAPGANAAPLPAVPDVLPQGTRIAVKLVGLKAAGSASANEVDGSGGFEQLHAAIVQDGGKELASVEIDGFHAAGSAAGKQDNAGASIRQIAIAGDPKLVDTLLKNPQVSGQPSVKAALDLVRSVGLDPAISGRLVAHDITAKHGPAGNSARGDFDGDFDVPQLGQLSVHLSGMTATAASDASTMSTQFDKCALTLKDHAGKEIAFLELDGGTAAITGASRHGQVKQLAARGNVAQLVTAGEAIVKHAPVDVRGALQAVRALGVTGNVTGSLAVDTDGKHTTFSGDFDASLDAGHTGSVAIHVGGLHGTDGGDVSFDTFTASMKDANGHQAASIDVEGGETGEAKRGNEAATRAKKISAKGEDATVNAMIAAIQAKATSLPAPVKASFAMVRRFYANAGGSITMTNAAMGEDKAGAEVARASNIDASFDLHGAGKANVALTGFKAALGAKSDSVSFTLFDAQLIDTAGHKAAHMRVEGSHDTFATVNKNDDFSLSAKSVHIDGDSKQTSALLAGIRQHISTLPQPIAAAFKLIERYTGEVAASGTIAASDVALDSKAGKLTGHGTIEGHVRVPEGTLDAKLTNSRSDGEQLAFDALDVSVRDPHGAVAATLHAAGAKADAAARAASLDDVKVHGDAAKLRGVLDPSIQRMMPPQVARALAMLDQSQLSVEATGVAVTPTRADVKTITATGTIEVADVGGKTYTARNAQLELDGTDVVLDAAGKPKELAVTAMSIRGNWASVGGGDALKGDATVRTGAARIELDANGAPKHVHVGSVFASGDASRTASAAPAPAAHPTKAQQIATLDSETQTAEAVAQQVQTADIRATVPLFAGRYGRGLAHVNVPAGAAISIAVEVQNNALTNATSVHIAPPLDIPAGSVKGVDLEAKGRDGILDAQVGGFSGFLARLFGKTNLNGMAVGKGPMSLDLPTLVRQVTDHMRQGIVDSKDAAPDPKAAQKAAQWMSKEQASWQKDHAKHLQQGASQKTLDKDAQEQPRSANIGDFATSGIDLARANASADIVLARTRDGVVSGHLHGAANGGGRMQMSADALNANFDGNQVHAAGVNTGVLNVQTKGNTTDVQLGGLRIDQLDWQRK
ncbi:MAG TPA: hypothetical protein VH143_28240 [Kofleriaceae bacterium]|nr:hypothetical protein [Kofleriaceae bacterium]